MPTDGEPAGASAANSLLDNEVIERAQTALDAMIAFLDEAIEEDVSALVAARNALHSVAPNEALVKTLLARADSLEVQGTLYGVPLIAALAGSLHKLIASAPDAQTLPLALVDAHVEALKAFATKARGEIGPERADVVRELRRSVRRTIADWHEAARA